MPIKSLRLSQPPEAGASVSAFAIKQCHAEPVICFIGGHHPSRIAADDEREGGNINYV